MQLEAGSAVEASPTFYQQEKLTNHTACVPCLLAPLHSELWLMSTGTMFILGSREPLGKGEEVWGGHYLELFLFSFLCPGPCDT